MGELMLWWLAIEAIGLAALPLTATLFARLPGRGWALSKPLGLLVLGWLIWFPLTAITALPYSRAWIAGMFVVFAAANIALLRRLPGLRDTLRELLRTQRPYIITSEALFLGGFVLMAWFRSFTPAVVDTEKFMDVAFISSIWRTPHLPPPDPWLSGHPINYYYFGHFLIASLAKVLDTQPGTAFNIGIALIFALAAVAIFGVAIAIVATAHRRHPGALTRALPFGGISALLVLVMGNLNGAQIWWQQVNAMLKTTVALHGNIWAFWVHRDLWTQYDWWSPSRVIPNTINEFPAFSFVLSDLHAHILALPFAALAVGIAFSLLLSDGEGIRAFGRGLSGWLSLVTAAILIGALYAINGWDLPTYLGLAILALIIQQWLAHGRRFTSLFLLDLFGVVATLTALCFLLYLPFYHGFVSPSEGTSIVPTTQRSPVGYEFAIFGLPFFLIASLLLLRLVHWCGTIIGGALRPATDDVDIAAPIDPLTWVSRHEGIAGGAVIVLFTGLLVLWTMKTQGNLNWTFLWCLLMIFACAALALRHLLPTDATNASYTETGATVEIATTNRAEVWVFVLAGTAAALVAAAELIYLKDIFNTRMNTVFKLYFQAWLLLGLAAGPACAWLLSSARATLGAWRASWQVRPAAPSISISTVRASAHALPRLALAGAAAIRSQAPSRENVTDDGVMTLDGGDSRGSSAHPLRSKLDLPPLLRWCGAGGILLWIGIALVLVAAALVYPVLAVSARTDNFTLPRTLDGTAYMATDPAITASGCTQPGTGSNHDDNYAIAWLNSHISGSQVIVEAPGCEWTHYSRVSAFTGLPTLLGWPGGHEGEWRANWVNQQTQGDIFGQRTDAINAIYTNQNPQTVMRMLHQYDVRLVYVGAAEQALYPNANLGRFGAFLRVIYTRGGVTIYSVPQGGS